MRECLESVKLSMKLGDVKSAYFLLQTRFAEEGYGKQVNMKTQNNNLNINVDATPTADEREKIRAGILERLQPRSRIMLPSNEEI